ncbi:hypothetical protein QLL95_gp0032 [Cotonvirus japonicus]|uniref:Uncharacterized protein n=1 Tax=Cotonvirus japonicus TaxID=2811091 RepID=A0ABM7NQT9_9VIRU|nr:hypothetical protein QLL95_gp0032 [Cotonvirus japonicus]BCS82521.1 hypothetical protein [Cotonvirus japonicus]
MKHNKVLLFAVFCAIIACSVGQGPTCGTPIIQYDQPFLIYAPTWKSYCSVSDGITFKCNIGQTNPNYATKFAINDGRYFGYPSRTGSVVTKSVFPNMLYVTTGSWNTGVNVAHIPLGAKNGELFFKPLNYLTQDPVIFQFQNNFPQGNGNLHGNVSEINFRNIRQPAGTGFCAASSSTTNNGIVSCDRTMIREWEAFFFIPWTGSF